MHITFKHNASKTYYVFLLQLLPEKDKKLDKIKETYIIKAQSGKYIMMFFSETATRKSYKDYQIRQAHNIKELGRQEIFFFFFSANTD